ncbi:hypothetical protein N7468_002305 [Penicillium chermesinum]|uniref:Uncharacterized protein n=1 Tax=Penicillium chermesinum TaxID=63820 RepID=A0A9W9PJM0_9EURO|nr:uncharacterized protein N7468_002305 [Penicillium chermesinum]KAJ5247322.1 hypothetical protein N7468_002305 [Penicillium chermesinum]
MEGGGISSYRNVHLEKKQACAEGTLRSTNDIQSRHGDLWQELGFIRADGSFLIGFSATPRIQAGNLLIRSTEPRELSVQATRLIYLQRALFCHIEELCCK